MPYVDLPGVRLWFEDSGGNHIPAIFLYAASGTFESWVHQLPTFTQAGFRCITYDRRGWGRSQPLETGDQPGRGSLDLHGLVDYLALDSFHLVATAAGGIVALDYALTFIYIVFSSFQYSFCFAASPSHFLFLLFIPNYYLL